MITVTTPDTDLHGWLLPHEQFIISDIHVHFYDWLTTYSVSYPGYALYTPAYKQTNQFTYTESLWLIKLSDNVQWCNFWSVPVDYNLGEFRIFMQGSFIVCSLRNKHTGYIGHTWGLHGGQGVSEPMAWAGDITQGVW